MPNASLNNIDQFGPDGSKTFDVTGYKQYIDRSNKNHPVKYKLPQYAETTTLSPAQQKIYNQQNGTKFNLAKLANNQSGFLNDYMAEPFRYDTNDHEQWAMSYYDKLNGDRETQQRQGLQSDLANSGIKLGSDAYDRAIHGQDKSTEDARNQFLLDSLGQGFGMAQATRNQPINEITSLMSGSQVSQPQFGGTPNYTIPTTDRAGINAAYDNNKLQAWQAEQAQRQAMMGGLFSLGSSFIGLSDRRAKKNIKKIGSIPIARDDGKEARTGLYSYNYKGEAKKARRHTGVMAQNLLKAKPSAVLETPSGLLAVNYSRVLENA